MHHDNEMQLKQALSRYGPLVGNGQRQPVEDSGTGGKGMPSLQNGHVPASRRQQSHPFPPALSYHQQPSQRIEADAKQSSHHEYPDPTLNGYRAPPEQTLRISNEPTGSGVDEQGQETESKPTSRRAKPRVASKGQTKASPSKRASPSKKASPQKV